MAIALLYYDNSVKQLEKMSCRYIGGDYLLLGRLLFVFIEMMILRRQIHFNSRIALRWEQDYKYRATSLCDYPDRSDK